MPFNSMISRNASGSDPLVPEPVSTQIIQEVPQASAVLSRARQVRLSTKTQRLPVLDVLPMAYFVSGDTGLKQTSSMDWRGVNLIVEEVAAIVPIPEAYLDDAQVPIWDEVRPRMVEAIGDLVDAACIFDVNRPSTWGTPIYQGAVAAGNTVVAGTGDDLAQDVASMGELLAVDGFMLNGFASRPGLRWRLVGLRSTDGSPIYEPNIQTGRGGNLYGYPLNEVANGSWDATEAELIGGDWTKAIVGIRQDISFRMFTEGVISDDSGNVVLNLMQQDAVAMRVVMRLAYATANPATRLNQTAATRFPFAVLRGIDYTYS